MENVPMFVAMLCKIPIVRGGLVSARMMQLTDA